jgi:hypothetical protein
MPDQYVPRNLHAVGFGKGDQRIGHLPVELAFQRLDFLPLHHVFGGHGVELPLHEFECRRLLSHYLCAVEGRADQESVRESVLERGWPPLCGRGGSGAGLGRRCKQQRGCEGLECFHVAVPVLLEGSTGRAGKALAPSPIINERGRAGNHPGRGMAARRA